MVSKVHCAKNNFSNELEEDVQTHELAVEDIKKNIEMGKEDKDEVFFTESDLERGKKIHLDYYTCWKALILNEMALYRLDKKVVELVKNKKLNSSTKA